MVKYQERSQTRHKIISYKKVEHHSAQQRTQRVVWKGGSSQHLPDQSDFDLLPSR